MTALSLEDFGAAPPAAPTGRSVRDDVPESPPKPAEVMPTPSPPPLPAPDVRAAMADLSFTYHEALTAVMAEALGLIAQMGDALLPIAANEAFGVVLRSALAERIDTAIAAPVTVTVGPADQGAAREALDGMDTIPIKIEVSSALAPGEASLHFGKTETAFDMAPLVEAAREAIASFSNRHAPTPQTLLATQEATA